MLTLKKIIEGPKTLTLTLDDYQVVLGFLGNEVVPFLLYFLLFHSRSKKLGVRY
jgi:hypothetical protein